MVSVNDIRAAVVEFYGVDEVDFYTERRAGALREARQIAYWLAREYTKLSYPALGRIFCRDHTTVLYGVRQVDRRRQSEPRTYAAIQELRRRLDAKHHRGGRLHDGDDPRASGE
jgi:chromosomal replication initiator protein